MDEVYRKLQEHLDRHPMGFPATKGGEDIKLLKKLFTTEQAEITLALTTTPETAEEIAPKLGSDPIVLAENLEQMAKDGLIMRTRKDGKTRYNLEPWWVGIMEFQIGRLDKELIELNLQYEDARGFEKSDGTIQAAESFKEGDGAIQKKTPFWRILPVEKSLQTETVIQPYEQISEIIDQAAKTGKIIATDCICRKQKQIMGEGCGRDIQVCLAFSPYAEFYLENGYPARELSKEEALEIVKKTEEYGCVHQTQNTASGPLMICNCCQCCCGILKWVIGFKQNSMVARSDYFSQVDEDTCVACEECVDRCPFHAISIEDDVARVDHDLCVGCGLCVSVCTAGALSLIRKPEDQIEPRPADVEAMYEAIGKEGGRTSMKVVKKT